MNIKEIIDAERISLEKVKARYGSIAYEVTGMLNRIEEKASNLLYPYVRKIWIDNEGSIRIDFFGNWHIAVQEGALYDLIEDAKAPLLKRIAELEAQNLNMMALFRDFYELEFNRDECWDIIKKYGGDA